MLKSTIKKESNVFNLIHHHLGMFVSTTVVHNQHKEHGFMERRTVFLGSACDWQFEAFCLDFIPKHL